MLSLSMSAVLLSAVLLSPAWAGQAQEIADPLVSQAFVSDGAQILDASAERRINALLGDLHRDLGVEVVVVTVARVEDGSPKRLTTELFETWQLGDAQTNTGMLVLIAVEERRLEMEPGYGLEGVMSDAWLGQLQREKMVPYLKQDDWAGGLLSGLAVVDAQLRNHSEEVRGGAEVPSVFAQNWRSFNQMAVSQRVMLVLLLGFPLWLFVLLPLKRRFFLTEEQKKDLAALPPGTTEQERRAFRRAMVRNNKYYSKGGSRRSSGRPSRPRSRGGRSGGGGAGSSF